MTLKELINRLEKEDPDYVVPMGFEYSHSYRGIYEYLAFAPKMNTTVREMLECAKSSIEVTYSGYKGGEYTMHEYTPVYLAEYGELGEEIGYILLNYMLGKYNK